MQPIFHLIVEGAASVVGLYVAFRAGDWLDSRKKRVPRAPPAEAKRRPSRPSQPDSAPDRISPPPPSGTFIAQRESQA